MLFKDLHTRTLELQETNKKLEVSSSYSPGHNSALCGAYIPPFSIVQKELVERITVQAELEHAMELAKAAAVSKNQFLANMSHEVHAWFRFTHTRTFRG